MHNEIKDQRLRRGDQMEKALINEIIVGILRYSESSLIGLTSSKTCSLMIEASCHNICSTQNIVRNIYIYMYYDRNFTK